MKNVTLSVPDDLLEKAREYARKHGTTLNQMIRDLLRETVMENRTAMVEEMQELYKKASYKGKIEPFNRNEIYER